MNVDPESPANSPTYAVLLLGATQVLRSFLKYGLCVHVVAGGRLLFPYQYDKRSLLSSPTVVLIIVNVIVYLILQLGGDPAYYLLGQQSQLVFQGFYWQLFTSMFVHFDIYHILFNMFALYYFGRLNEAHFSDSRLLAIYFGSGLLGNVMSLFLLGPTDLSGGASGAIFGLVGSYVAIARKAQHMGVALLYAIIIFVESSGAGVNIFAHLFGLVGGLALGLMFASRRQRGEYNSGYTFTT